MALQVEGAFVFGLGMMTTEEVVIDAKTGRLLTDSTWTYKIPTAPCVPSQFNVSFLKVRPEEHMWTTGVPCSLLNCLRTRDTLHSLGVYVLGFHVTSNSMPSHIIHIPCHIIASHRLMSSSTVEAMLKVTYAGKLLTFLS